MQKLFLLLVCLFFSQASSSQEPVPSDEGIRLAATKAFEEELRNKKPAIDQDFSRRATCVARSLIDAIPSEKVDPEVKWSIHVYEDNSSDVIALPSGHLIINSGMASVIKSSDELAAAIATPMSGVLLKHGQKRSNRQTIELVLAANAAATRKSTTQLAELVAQAQELKDAEFLAADQLGRSLMKSAGFDPLSQLALLERLASDRPSAKTHFDPRIQASRKEAALGSQREAVSRNSCTRSP